MLRAMIEVSGIGRFWFGARYNILRRVILSYVSYSGWCWIVAYRAWGFAGLRTCRVATMRLGDGRV